VRVGVAVQSLQGYAAGALSGIAAYARQQPDWILSRDSESEAGVQRLLAESPDGILILTWRESILASLTRTNIPVVNMVCHRQERIGIVHNDDLAIGELAAQHFLTRGYQHFAYCPITHHFLDQRLEGFQKGVNAAGKSVHVLPAEFSNFEANEEDLGRWLLGLPKPVALFCATDLFAAIASECCARLKIRVPLEIAVLGVDNTTTTCLLAMPQLSSVQVAAERIGYEAAGLLQQLMMGAQPASLEIRVPPVRVVARRSTDALVANDEVAERALCYMREHLESHHSVNELCRAVHCSRSVLGRRFSLATGLTLGEAWNRFRIEKAQRLLAETDLNLARVAELSGFAEARHLSQVFKRFNGQTPGEFRHRVAP